MPKIDLQMPLWQQIVVGVWALGNVALFVRQILVAYAAALGGG
ncbi:MAG: hypothetical protein ABFE08_12085 [Armatimonadia bacterium]